MIMLLHLKIKLLEVNGNKETRSFDPKYRSHGVSRKKHISVKKEEYL